MTRTPWIPMRSRRASIVPLWLSVGVTLGSAACASSAVAQAGAKPEEAAPANIAAFDTYEVVGVGAAHGEKDLDDFLLSLIRHPMP